MNLRWCTLFLSIILLFIVETVSSDNDCIFEHLSTDDGLSHGSVSVMLKDHRGFMWFATWDGINRYDGQSFKVYKPGTNSPANSASNRIESMIEDNFGNIWVINYAEKAFRLNRNTERFEEVPFNIADSLAPKVTGIFPTTQGEIWLTTSNAGAFQVITDSVSNEISVTHYHEKSKVSLPGNSINFVIHDAKNNIWINTGKGLIGLEYHQDFRELAPKTFSASTINLLTNLHFTSFYENSAHLFFGTSEGRLFIYDFPNNDFIEVKIQNNAEISHLTGNNKGSIFIGTMGNGVYVYSEKHQKIIHHYQHPSVSMVLKTYTDSKGMLWVETTDAGISKIDLNSGEYRKYQQSLEVNQAIKLTDQCGIQEDGDQLWLTLKGGGFGYYNNSTDEVEYFFNKPGDPNSKTSNFVNCFYKDPSGVLWMSTYFKGIEKVTFVQKKFRFVQPAPQSDFSIANEVRALMEDSKGILWVATKNQELFLLNKNDQILHKIDRLNGQKPGMVYALMEDSKGNIFIGTKGNGLFQLTRNGKFDFEVTHFVNVPNNISTLSNNNIYTLHEDRKGNIWIGTYGGGVNLFQNNRFLHAGNGLIKYPLAVGAKVRHITEDHLGNIWVGSTNGIFISHYESTAPGNYSFQFFNNENSPSIGLKSNDIFWIFCDRSNTIWVASLGGGLAQLKNDVLHQNGPEFSVKTIEHGLSSDVVFTITDDENGNLWMSTENGIAFYQPQKQTFINYNKKDGIVNSGFSEGAVVNRADGSICFGANNGIYRFTPTDFKNDQKNIDIVFTDFKLLGKNVLPGNGSALNVSITENPSIQLKHHQNVIEINWAALDFIIQDKIQYEYFLEGYDHDWIFVNDQHRANYSMLPPGKYTFWVRFNQPELQEFNQPESLSIEIFPPFWATTWAYIVYLVLGIGLVEMARRIITSMIRLRNKVVIEKELSNIKINFFTNISHELKTPLTLILGPANELKQHEILSEKGKTYLQLIEQNSQRLLGLVNQLLDFRKIQSNKMELDLKEINLVPFLQKVCTNFDELAREKKIRFSVESLNKMMVASIDEEKMESVLFNLLSNAFKFTPEEGEIKVMLKENKDRNEVIIAVQDTGTGVSKAQEAGLFEVFVSSGNQNSPNSSGTGIGLALSKELVTLHQGELKYLPTPGGGATFNIILKGNSSNSENGNNFQPTVHSDFAIEIKYPQQETGRKSIPRILIVEDNHELRKFIGMQLTDAYEVYEATNGAEGWLKAAELQPDILLSDVMMPEMDGIELLKKMKNNFETSHIPVVLLTAKSSVESKIEGLNYGADAYLTKPFHSGQLKAQLENLLHQRMLLRQIYSNSNNGLTFPPSITLTERDALFLNQVREILEENLDRTDFRIEDIYKKTGMGRSKFFEKMKGLTGLPPIDFVKEYRLNKAQSLLQTGNYNVSETSFLSGFSDAGYFSKCYKEKFGISPSQMGK